MLKLRNKLYIYSLDNYISTIEQSINPFQTETESVSETAYKDSSLYPSKKLIYIYKINSIIKNQNHPFAVHSILSGFCVSCLQIKF